MADDVLHAVEGRGVISFAVFAVSGYYFDGRCAIDLAIDRVVNAVIIVSRPSQVEIPRTFEVFAAPLLEMGNQDRAVDIKKARPKRRHSG